MAECDHCETFTRRGDSRNDLDVQSEPSEYWVHVDAKEAFFANFYRSWEIAAFPTADAWHVRVYYPFARTRQDIRDIYDGMCSLCLKVILGNAWALAHYN